MSDNGKARLAGATIPVTEAAAAAMPGGGRKP